MCVCACVEEGPSVIGCADVCMYKKKVCHDPLLDGKSDEPQILVGRYHLK